MRDFEIASDEIQVRVERQAQQALSTGLLASQQGVTIVQEVPTTSGSVGAHYITTQAEAALSNEFSLGSLGSGLLKQSVAAGVSAPAIATATDVSAPVFAEDAGASDTYAATLAPIPASYITGTHYRFKANTANTGAATINFNSLGAKTIVKVAGGITTALADNDIRAGQWVDLVYDGTNMQMQSTLGNAIGGVAWTSYTPTITSGTGALSSASATAYHETLGKTVRIRLIGTITTNGTGATDVRMTLPVATRDDAHLQVMAGIAGGVSGKSLQGYIVANTSTLIIRNYDTTYPGADSEVLYMQGTYESV